MPREGWEHPVGAQPCPVPRPLLSPLVFLLLPRSEAELARRKKHLTCLSATVKTLFFSQGQRYHHYYYFFSSFKINEMLQPGLECPRAGSLLATRALQTPQARGGAGAGGAGRRAGKHG